MSTALGSTLDQAADAIAAAPSLALACHHTPDGDALGSMLALHHLALAAGKQSVASWPEPFDVPPHYTFLPGLELTTKPADFPAEPDLMVTFDCGSLGRLAELAPAAQRAHQLIVVDHHSTNDGYGTVNLIDPDAAASAVVVRSLLARLGWDLNREAAQCLYTGLVCDTGRFQYDCTTPEVFELAQELARFDLPIGAMNRQLFEEHRLAYLRLAGAVLQRAEYDGERRFVAGWITAADLAEYGVGLDETEGLIDLLRRTTEADISAVLKETPDGTKASLRSVNGFDVGELAIAFGGGGHRSAAGFVSPLPVPELFAALRDALPVVTAD
ncbi:MAG TPA: bifunctional oligoribonuclease/PAP phosphatase NrnA [Acidimicrobiales bacterium]|jgi:phosphoesterase RecJ-like protein|nr:bifunctional oligoribonuclease/PAP phosphatase NrnA [Acidimicrobiales bacterium]